MVDQPLRIEAGTLEARQRGDQALGRLLSDVDPRHPSTTVSKAPPAASAMTGRPAA